MKLLRVVLFVVSVLLILVACQSEKPAPSPDAPGASEASPAVSPSPDQGEPEAQDDKNKSNLAVSAFQKGGCGACHVIPGVPGASGMIGPDLSAIGDVVEARLESDEYSGQAANPEDYLREAITAPDAYIAPDCSGKPCSQGLMPASLAQALSPDELQAVVDYMKELP